MIKIYNNISPTVEVKLYNEFTSELIYEAYISMSQSEYSDLSNCFVYTDRNLWETSPVFVKVLGYICDEFGLSNLDGLAVSMRFETDTSDSNEDGTVIKYDDYDEDLQPYI